MPLAVYAAGGLTLGLAWSPGFAWLAWFAVALVAVAVHRTPSVGMAFVGGWVAHLISHAVGFAWVPTMNRITFGYAGVSAVAFDLAEFAVWTVGHPLALTVAYAIARDRARDRWRVPVAVWLPLAWLAGERVAFALVGVAIDDWLTTQWTVEPVLRTLGHLGWWPTAIACLLAAACLGQALAERRWQWLMPSGVIASIGLLMPSLPVQGLEHLEGIAAVHLQDAFTLPHRAPPGERIELVVWPEDARHLRPYLGTGPARGTRIEPFLPDSPAQHLIGLVTRSPMGRDRNQFVVAAPDGRVVTSRAKRHLMPVAERSWFGLIGDDRMRPGHAAPRFDLGGRPVIPLICGELMARSLVAEGREAGGEVLLVGARDQMMVTEQSQRQLLAVQVLRSVEYGVPSVRSSLGGWASFVSSDGTVLARSERGRNGFLMWDRDRGARGVDFHGRLIDGPAPPAEPPRVAVLYSAEVPRFRARCPEGVCRWHTLEDFTCPGQPADTVIVSGHGQPPTYLSHTPAEVAAAVRCFAPELVVMDTCYGASSAIFSALGDLSAIVVAATSLVPVRGLHFGPGFFSDAAPAERAAAVALPGGELTRWRIDRRRLDAFMHTVDAMPPDDLRAALVRRDPTEARLPLPGAGHILVPVEWSRVADARPAPRPRRPRR